MPEVTTAPPSAMLGLLRFARFSILDAWAYEDLFSLKKSHSAYASTALRELITQRKGFIKIDDNQSYKRCRVQLRAQGVNLRDEVLGARIKTKHQQLCRTGDFIVAEIDAKLGGFGIVPEELDRAVVSSHYFLFDVDETLLSRDFLALCLRTDYFQNQVRATGSTNYAAIRPYHVLDYHIPLPAFGEQENLVSEHRRAISRAEAADADAAKYDREAVHFLEERLGLQPQVEKTGILPAKLLFIRFAGLERWGSFFLGNTEEEASKKYPIVRLGDVIADLQNGWSPKCHNRPANSDEWGVLKLGAVSFGEYNDAANKALPAELKPVPQLEVKQSDVLISRANITQYVCACVHVESTRDRVMLCDNIFRVAFKNRSKIDGQFLAAVMKTHPVRNQIENSLTGTSPTMKNISKPALLNLRFPLPPLDEQARIVAELERLRKKAREARQFASACRESAAKNFEKALFESQ